jgi:hypothetical protein
VKTPARTLPVPTSTPMNASSMTGPDAKLGDKISLADGARKRRAEKAQNGHVVILHCRLYYNLTYAILML